MSAEPEMKPEAPAKYRPLLFLMTHPKPALAGVPEQLPSA
ncbi:hypothetical protein L195_g064214, partial [Trifolium pratense]